MLFFIVLYTAPYRSVLGYKSENKSLVIVEEEAKIVRHIFDLYVGGKGYKAIAGQLNKEGYRTKRNGTFAIATVRTIITNPLYAGFIRFNQHQDWTNKKRKGTNPSLREEFVLTYDTVPPD